MKLASSSPIIVALSFLLLTHNTADGFSSSSSSFLITNNNDRSNIVRLDAAVDESEMMMDRRSVLSGAITTTSAAATALLTTFSSAHASVGSLPEYQDTNMVLQGITVKVTDPSQLTQMISFLQICFEFKILRSNADASDVWLGFGPEQMSIPKDFTPPVSSFQKYGGHASIHLQYDIKATSSYYRIGEEKPPGDNIEYLQVGVPQYRVTQMIKEGGNVIDAYGFVNVISPSGLPMRGIVGIVPDPMMFVAIRCANVEESKAFYTKELGFTEQEYPYCRLLKGKGDFEPPQPKNSVYLAPSKNSMGILLLPSPTKKKKIIPSPAIGSLDLVYTGDLEEGGILKDPSGVTIALEKYASFETNEKRTKLPP